MEKRVGRVLLFIILAGVFCMKGSAPVSAETKRLQNANNWFVLFEYPASKNREPIPWEKYNMAILDLDYHPPLEEAAATKCVLIAYVSFGEAERYRSYWPKIKEKPWLAEMNPYWKGYLVDVRSLEWQELVLHEIIPKAISKGFQGIFMDTLSTGSYLEWEDRIKYAGAEKAMIDLVRKAHGIYPDLLLISNNGYEILPRIAPYLDGILVEGINSELDIRKGGQRVGFKKKPVATREGKIRILSKMQRKHGLPVFALDYAPPEDHGLVEECREESRRLGFKPYVAGKKLSRIYPQS